MHTFRVGLLPATGVLWVMEICSGLVSAGDEVGDGRKSLATLALLSSSSWELGGSRTSLLGTGVDSFLAELPFILGRLLALVVSLRQVEGLGVESGEALDRGDDAGPLEGVAFWKKEKIDFCLLAELAGVDAPLAAFGVRAAAPFSPAMMTLVINE